MRVMKWLQVVAGKMELWVLLGAGPGGQERQCKRRLSSAPSSSHGCFSVLLSESVSVLLSSCASDADGRSPCGLTIALGSWHNGLVHLSWTLAAGPCFTLLSCLWRFLGDDEA